ncbi:MAG: DUF2147 domain-containing protein [Acidobacteria bacterium]|nr:DUF2147 domain-containing protein [Acidobacteriota bacterium]
MKRTLVFLCSLILAVAGASAALAAGAEDVLGLWATTPTERGYAKVKVFEEGGKYFGEIIWLSKPTYDDSEGPEWAGKTKVDRKNPDKKMQSKPIIGLRIVKDMSFKGDGLWEGGTIYDPENGKTYKSKMTLDGDKLNVRGFIGFSLIGRTSQWTRVEEEMMDEMKEEMKEETHETMNE